LSVQAVMGSKWGYYFVSIREDQDAAESLGINTHFYKMVSLNTAAFLTGMAGSLFMNYMGFIDPEVVFSLHDISIMAILVGIVGGVGTIYGPVVGAFIMVAVHEFFRTGFFGFFKAFAALTGSELVNVFAKYVMQAHVLGFGILVVLVRTFERRISSVPFSTGEKKELEVPILQNTESDGLLSKSLS